MSERPFARPNPQPVKGPRIRTRADGPLVVYGPFTLVDAAGNEIEVADGENVALCRCGHSATKPFCDGAHRTVHFVSGPSLTPET